MVSNIRRITHLLSPGDPALHDLIPLGPTLPGALTTAEIDATMAYAEAEKALATRAAYAPATGVTSPRGAAPEAPRPCRRTSASSPPTCPASPTRAARPAPSAAGLLPSATTTRWAGTSRRPTRRASRRYYAESAAPSGPPSRARPRRPP